MKNITVCGSLKYKNKMMQIAEKLTLEGNCILSIVFPTNSNRNAYTKEEKDLFGKMHKERIRISNAVLVVNIDNYIGSSTKSEIAFAKALGKEIMYYTDFINDK